MIHKHATLPLLFSLAALGLAAALPQAARAQTTLSGDYKGYFADAAGSPYTVTDSATFNNDPGSDGLDALGATVTVNPDSGGNSAEFENNGDRGLYALRGSTVFVNGGTFSGNDIGLQASSSTVSVSGGTFSGNGFGLVSGSSTVTVSGGTFSGNGTDLAAGGGSITLVGTDLAFVGDPGVTTESAPSTTGFITGFLRNDPSAPLDLSYFIASNGGRITLDNVSATPEPSAFVGLSVGLLGLGALAIKARQRNASAV